MRLSAIGTRGSDCGSTGRTRIRRQKEGEREREVPPARVPAFISFKHALNKTGLSREPEIGASARARF